MNIIVISTVIENGKYVTKETEVRIDEKSPFGTVIKEIRQKAPTKDKSILVKLPKS